MKRAAIVLATAVLCVCASRADEPQRKATGPSFPVVVAEGMPATITAGELIGLTIPDIRARLGGGMLQGEVGPSIVMEAGDGGVMSYLVIAEALADPVRQARQAAGERGWPQEGEWSDCQIGMSSAPYGHNALLILKDGRVAEVRRPDLQPVVQEPRPEPRPGESQSQAFKRRFDEKLKQPRRSYVLSTPGKMPLAEGPNFVANWRGAVADPGETISVTCRRQQPGPPIELPRAKPGLRKPTGSDMQALALAPFAILLPSINADRRKAMTEGRETMGLIALSQPVPGGAVAFAKQHKRAFWYPGPDDYGILVFDLGMIANNNLSARSYLGYAGVRGGRVVWIAREVQGPDSMGMHGNYLCLDANNVSANTRKGCEGYGNLKPKK